MRESEESTNFTENQQTTTMKIINHFKTCASIFLAAVLATSCEKPFFDEAVNTPEQVPNKANSTLTITTRSNDSQAEDAELKVSYPVVLYVFDST